MITLTEYLDHIRSSVDLRDLDSVAASAPMLRALANDRSLVVRELNRRIENSMSSKPEVSAQTVMLGRGDEFYVRANIWPAIADMAAGRAYQDQVAYSLAHDHNFTFLTVTHLGPGYETEVYEYDYDSIEGYVGEPVELRFLEKVRFSSGSVMLYRASCDAHVQHAPEELTITLNLMVSLPEVRVHDQYHFDLKSRTVSGYPAELQASGRSTFVDLAGFVGDANTAGLLSDLAVRHPCRRTRLSAFSSLAKLRPGAASETWALAAADRDRMVANKARSKLREFEKI